MYNGKGVNVCVITEQKKRFADAYIKDPNMTRAAIKAGYSKQTAGAQGSRLFKDVEVQQYINNRLNKHEKKEIASQEEVLETLTAIMRQQKFDSVVIKTMDGHETVQVPNKVNDAFKAADALAKRYGLYVVKDELTEASESTGTVEIPARLPSDVKGGGA